MFESCLQSHSRKPEMKAVHAVEDALKEDQQAYAYKYRESDDGTLDDSQSAPAGMARFTVKLPVGPQHEKFREIKLVHDIDEDYSGGVRQSTKEHQQSVKFNIQTLRKWFWEMDEQRTGSITQRVFIAKLRQRKDLHAMFASINAQWQENQDNGKDLGDSKNSDEPLAAGDQARAEHRRIKQILKEIDSDGSGSMEWEEFVEFFRRAGVLLEYETQEEANSTQYNADSVLKMSAAKSRLSCGVPMRSASKDALVPPTEPGLLPPDSPRRRSWAP